MAMFLKAARLRRFELIMQGRLPTEQMFAARMATTARRRAW
jgi:hypothetical protein